MIQPGTFERVYAAIKGRLQEGVFKPGAKLEPAVLSEELNASVTPVRDALHRLTGERLVEAPRHEGFRAPLLTEAGLRHLYAWHLDLLLLASARHALLGADLDEGEETTTAETRLRAIVERLAESAGPELAAALKNTNERLQSYRLLEGEFIDGIEDEASEVIAALSSTSRSALRRALVRYHRRRQKVVPELLERLYRA